MDRIARTIEPASNAAAFRLCGFLLASLCVHTAVLLMPKWNSAADGVPRTEPGLSMTLSLVEPAAPKPTARPPSARPARITHHVQPKTRSILTRLSVSPRIQAQTVGPTEPTSPQQDAPAKVSALPMFARASDGVQTEPAHTQTAGGTNGAELGGKSAQAQIQTLILTDLTRRFVYPALARRRGWQGTVLLALTVKPSGVLDRIRVAQSSGYDVLDRSAVDTMRHIERIAQARQWLGGQALELRLPVEYRLIE
jgi:periplasmic protein TonB